jgi:hypothetical protein
MAKEVTHSFCDIIILPQQQSLSGRPREFEEGHLLKTLLVFVVVATERVSFCILQDILFTIQIRGRRKGSNA